MIKNLLSTLILSLAFSGIAIASISDEYKNKARPIIQLMKDGNVVETRKMNELEYQAFSKVHYIERQMDELEAPLDELEHDIEDNAEALEAAVEQVVQNSLAGNHDQSDFNHEMFESNIAQKLEEMVPTLKKINDMAEEIELAAKQLEDAFYQQYNKDDFDSIRVLDGDDRISFHFNEVDD